MVSYAIRQEVAKTGVSFHRRVPRFACAAALAVLFAFAASLPGICGELDDTALDYVYSVFAPGKTAGRRSARVATKTAPGGQRLMAPDATARLMMVAQHWDDFSEETRAAIRPFFDPAEGSYRAVGREAAADTSAGFIGEQTYSTAHFTFHYTLSTADDNAVKSFDYVQNMSAAFEEAYRKLVTEIGFPAPKLQDGETKYHIYIADLLHCGYTSVIEDDCTEMSLLGFMMPLGTRYPFSFFIFMDHDYDLPWYTDEEAWNQAKTTAAHEFFHAIQFGRTGGPDSWGSLWFIEGQAVWAQDLVFDDVNDYMMYLYDEDDSCGSWFACPYKSLADDNNYFRPYANGLFFKFIAEVQNKPNAVLTMQNMAVTRGDALDTLQDYVVSELGMDLKTLMTSFGASFADPSGYRDASLYSGRTAWYSNISLERYSFVSNTTHNFDWLSFRAFKLGTGETGGTVNTSIFSASTINFDFLLCSASGSCSRKARLSSFGNASYGYVDPSESAFLIVGNGGMSSTSTDYSADFNFVLPQTSSISVIPGGWNAILLPVTPIGKTASSVFRGINSDYIYIVGDQYISAESDAFATSLKQGSVIWIYPDAGQTTISIICENPNYSSQTKYSMVPGKIITIGTLSQTSIEYDDSNITIDCGGFSKTISQAIDANCIGPLYDYNPDNDRFEEVPVGTGMLQPRKAYFIKTYGSGSIYVNNY